MATAGKILIRVTKYSGKVSKVIDVTESFNQNDSYVEDLSGWDAAVVQFVDPNGAIYFQTTNDDGSTTGQLLPSPEVPINWVNIVGLDLSNKTDVNLVTTTSIIKFDIIGKYLRIILD